MDSHSHPEISGLESRVSGVESSVARLRSRVDAIEGRLLAAVSELKGTVDEFVTEYRRDRIVQNAHNDLAEARRELDQEFGRYKEVRDLASGIIYVVRSGFLSRAVILDVSERLAIRTPRYWLAPAILAVAAWLDGDKERYFESIKSALALDHSKTALFMALLLRDQARNEDMREWIGSYLAGLEPTNLPTDFAVVIEAVTGRTLGADSAPQLVRRMRGWYETAARSRDAEADEIGQWERNLLGLAAAGDYAEAFPILAKSSPEWELLRKRHEADTALEASDRYFRRRFEEGADIPADLDEKISLLLKSLAEDPDRAEDQILQRIRRAEVVIETQDHAAAERRVAAEEADRTRALNILSLVTRAAFPTGRRRSPTMTELLAIVMSQRFISAAAERIHSKYQRPTRVEIDLGQRKRSFSIDAETTPEALRQQADDLAKQLAGEIDDQTAQQRDELRRRGRRRMIVGAAISGALAVAAFISWSVSSVLAIFILALACVPLGYAFLYRLVRLQVHMRAIEDDSIREKSNVTSTLSQVSGELATLFSQQQRSKDLLPRLRAYILELTVDDAYRAIRFTAPPLPTLMLPGPADHDSPEDAGPAETRDDGFARGFPEWTPWPPTRTRQLPGPMAPPG